jgi:heme/copper-type cytochrome/quinol oxidase subunit 2
MIALINIIVCCAACVFHYRDSKRHNQSFAKWLGNIIVASIFTIQFLLPVWFFCCLPIKFKAKTRHARRYTAKTGLRAVQATEVQLEKLAKESAAEEAWGGDAVQRRRPSEANQLGAFLRHI